MNSLVTEKKVQDILFKYKPTTPYPNNNLGTSLKNVAALIAAGLPTRVYFVSISGFDTHSNQLVQHSNLLSQLSSSLHSFQKDLTANKLDGQVTTMTFSEFGRRPNENDSGGTDHGTAAPLFIMGSKVKGGVLGSAPSLKLQKNQDVVYSTDFREVYATVLENWLHERDIAGWLLDGGNGETWEHVNCPAITAEGESLWPEKWSLDELRRMEQANPYVFAGQYLQRPAPPEGGGRTEYEPLYGIEP